MGLTFPGEQTSYDLLKGRAWFSFMWELLCIALVVKRSHNVNKNEDLSSNNCFIYINNCNRFSMSQELPSCNTELWSLGVTKQFANSKYEEIMDQTSKSFSKGCF